MNKVIQLDLLRIGISENTRLRKKLKILLSAYGFHVLWAYRMYKAARQKPYLLPLCPLILLIKVVFEKFYDIHISLNAEISAGLYIGHFGGINIGYCSIGELCNINHQVSIGISDTSNPQNKVAIGDKVWIGPHTKILPGKTISSQVTISAGTSVNKDIPSLCLVAGPDCRVINNDYDNSEILKLDT